MYCCGILQTALFGHSGLQTKNLRHHLVTHNWQTAEQKQLELGRQIPLQTFKDLSWASCRNNCDLSSVCCHHLAFAIISLAVTQRACCPDIPRPSARPGHASHQPTNQPTSHLPPSHHAPFGMASVWSTDLPTKDYRMFQQALGYSPIFKWPFNPMVSVWADRDLGTPLYKMPRC